jgi:hypothetical protein
MLAEQKCLTNREIEENKDRIDYFLGVTSNASIVLRIKNLEAR